VSSGWDNPYKTKIGSFPGRLFPFDDSLQDKKSLLTVISNYRNWVCEIGSGTGGHLLERALKSPEPAYIGIELRYKRSFRTIEKALDRNISNVFLCRTKGEGAAEVFPPRSVSGIYVNFPDPWSKNRWKKHQILNSEFLAASLGLLKDGGFLSVKTDHEDYFAEFLEITRQLQGFSVVEHSADLYSSQYLALNVETEFERLFRSQSLPIYYVKLLKHK
jgi:tRNA (guanine-N7-)-methyltransferase